jgi:glyoxylase-like metal-dependent hydrolase (beta-lactamase superfamily II)
MRVSYRLDNLLPLERSGRLQLLDGDTEVLPGIRTQITGGHTRAHQCVIVSSQGESLLFPADICPTPAHVRGPYTMAYDMVPYDTIQAKAALLGQAADEGWLIVFDHEAEQKVARLERVEGQLVARAAG